MRQAIAVLVAVAVLAGCITIARSSDVQFLENRQGPQVREFTIEAVDKDIELYPGKTVRMWTFNGMVPGPLIRATEGDRVIVHFYNNGTAPHTIHFHGSHPFDLDGADHQGVEPGGSTVYDFIAGPAGAYVYHCHIDTPVHIPMGLYGQFIVDPKGGWSDEPVDKELFAVFSDWNPRHNVTAETYLFNGKAYPATETLQVEQGDRVRVFLSSMSDFPVAAHLHGYLPEQVWPSRQPIDVMPLAHAETRVMEFTANNPGAWMFHDHYEQHLTNDGIYPGGGLNAIEVGSQYWGKFHEMMGSKERIAVGPASGGHGGSAAPAGAAAGVPEGATRVSTQDFQFAPAELTVEAGATVAWVNDGGAPHTVTSSDGGPLDSGIMKAGAVYTHTFDKPGVYHYRCEPHSAKGKDGAYAGMVGVVRVV